MSDNPHLNNYSKALIIKDQKIFLLRRINKSGNWYQLPGAQQNFRETLHDTLLRYFNENLGERIDIKELKFVREYVGVNHEYMERDADIHKVDHIFSCRFRSTIEDSAKLAELSKKGYDWVNMAMLDKIQFIPKELIKYLHPDGTVSGEYYLGDLG